eukprot:5456387-Karenia_brevis.AAC.1
MGIDRSATNALLDSGRLADYEAGVLRTVLAGAVWTQERLFKANLSDSECCPHCSKGIEDQMHMWWT